jgi:LmbE family N-acetylglucosaminyl deacetylase
VAFGLSERGRFRVAVLSPHLDDAILSLGASIADAVRCGHEVSVVTVFAGNPESEAPAGSWDARAGFPTEGAATRARRDEDRRACEVVGARPVWLPFGDSQYDGGRDPNDVWSHVAKALEGADTVLVPGRPLIHRDHLWLAELVRNRLSHRAVGIYAELPYDRWASSRKRRQAPRSVPEVAAEWMNPLRSNRSRILKWRACREYSSQLPWLGRGLPFRRALLQSRLGSERIAWLPR